MESTTTVNKAGNYSENKNEIENKTEQPIVEVKKTEEEMKEEKRLSEVKEAHRNFMSLRHLQLYESRKGKTMNETDASLSIFQFWESMPLPKIGNFVFKVEQLVQYNPSKISPTPNKITVQSRTDAKKMVEMFDWEPSSNWDINNEKQMDELHDFLRENYHEELAFRIHYSKEFLRWFLNSEKYWIVGVRFKAGSRRLVAVICARKVKVRVYDTTYEMAETAFMCLHKNIRRKRLAPKLMEELKRQVTRDGVQFGIFCNDYYIPTPYSGCRVLHRHISVEKLIDEGISELNQGESLVEKKKVLSLSNKVRTSGFRPLEEKDIKEAHLLFTEQDVFNVYPAYTETEFRNTFLGNPSVVRSYVVENSSHRLTDFISFFMFDYELLNPINPANKIIRVAKLFHSVFSTGVPISGLVKDTIMCAQQLNVDLFNAMDNLENRSFLYELKFEVGSRQFFHYLLNLTCERLKAFQDGYTFLE
jgi:glycylpeptide N-tetradecanoyltransferase